MITAPSPDQLSVLLRAALAAERAQDRALIHGSALDRPTQIRTARPQDGGTTVLALERPVRLGRGSEVILTGAGGMRTARVLGSDGGPSIEVEGVHADARAIMGRPLHLTDRLGASLAKAIFERTGVLPTAAGWRPARLRARPSPAESLLDGMEADQADVLQRSLGSDLLLVLGPPGTGKTSTLARTVAALLLSGERVLLLAPTHAAIDTALARIDGVARTLGIPRTSLLRQGRHGASWTGESLGGAHRPDVESVITALEQRGQRLGRTGWDWTWNVAATMGADWTHADRLRRLESRAQAVVQANAMRIDAVGLLREVRALQRSLEAASTPPRLVAATLAEALVRPPAGPWDAVVVDEASMASVPYALWAASLARKRVLLWGDPHQLGPVCAVRDPAARTLLARSLFHHLGCDRAGIDDPRRPVLRVQHRMAPPIRKLVADAFYDGRLCDGATVAARPGSVEIVDSAGLARAQPAGASRVNETHARMAAAQAKRLLADGARSIAVLTPYRAQVDRLRDALAERVPGLERSGGLVGTIHSAQGGEHDAVVVDLVCTRDHPGRFLDERANPEAASLLCVAFSRARHRLVVIADMAALPHGGIAERTLTTARTVKAA